MEEHLDFFSEQQESSLLQHSEQTLLQFAFGQHGALAGQHWLQVLEQGSAQPWTERPRRSRVARDVRRITFMGKIYLGKVMGQRPGGASGSMDLAWASAFSASSGRWSSA